jgi:hypothetical protein
LRVNQFRIHSWVKKVKDSDYAKTKPEGEVGNDLVGSVVPLLMKNHKEGTFHFRTRSEGNKLIESLSK